MATRILVIEDENIVAKDIQLTLEGLGYAVPATAASGEEAVRKAGEIRPDLVLMDIVLRGAMDGVEAAQQIRARLDLPVIYLTAHADPATLQRARITEPFGYILKPFEERDLHSAIEMALYKHSMEKKLRASERRAEFLAEASAVLASSIDYRATLAQVVRLAVPRLADWCAVHLLGQDGAIQPLAVAHQDPAKEQAARDWERACLADPNAAHGVARVLASGQREFYPEIPEDVSTVWGHNAEQLPPLRGLGLRSSLVVPLPVRGERLGTLALRSADPGRRYGPDDLTLAEDLAQRMALAVDNARLFQATQEEVRARDRFLAVASHELRTPLTPLQLQIDYLRRVVRSGTLAQLPPARVVDLLDRCERQVQQMTGLINDLLDISRIAAGRLELQQEDVDLASLAHDVVTRFEPELAEAGCPVTLHASAPVVGRWDPHRLDQVVTNLISNALKYGRHNPIQITVEADPASARLKVEDQGIGIAPEHQGRIFARFERAVTGYEYGGLGLGLYIVRQIVEALGGSIGVTSEPGVGSTFTVELPLLPSITAKAAKG